MRSRPPLALLATLALLAGGCGTGSGSAQESSRQAQSTAVREEGAEESIEGFGREANGSNRTAVLGAEQGYLRAVGDKDYVAACSHLSAAVQRSLMRLVAGRARKRVHCPQVLPLVLTPEASRVAAAQAGGRIVKVRVGGERAFVVFHSPGARLFQFAMTQEGGEWKVTTAAPSVLAPSTASLGR